jgi:hypothetical protein
MEGYTIEKLPCEPIIFTRLSVSVSFDDGDPDPEGALQVKELMDSQEEPFYYIFDLGEVKFDLTNLILAANRGAGSEGMTLRHPMIREVLVVTQSKLINLAAKGLNSEAFGNVPTSVFDTINDALDYARAQIAAQ